MSDLNDYQRPISRVEALLVLFLLAALASLATGCGEGTVWIDCIHYNAQKRCDKAVCYLRHNADLIPMDCPTKEEIK